MTIPFVDLQGLHASIQSELDEAVARTVSRSAFIGGEQLQLFESEFAAYCGAGRGNDDSRPGLACASCGNGTDALYLVLRALGVGADQEVITVANTFIATAEAISLTGATPIFVDIDAQTLLMDPAAVEAAITPRTAAIVPVHLYGQMCDMDRIMTIAHRHGLHVVEDGAQAHGARWAGRGAGHASAAVCFSFYPGKNLGAFGDAGAVVSLNADLIERVRMLANHGRKEKHLHEFPGLNSRMDALQAAILRVKLRHLDKWNDARRDLARQYISAIQEAPLRLPCVHPNAEPVWHLFVVRLSDRDHVAAILKKHGVETGLHYPIPLHFQPAYGTSNCGRGCLPVTERAAGEVLSLPMHPLLTDQHVARVAECLIQIHNRKTSALSA